MRHDFRSWFSLREAMAVPGEAPPFPMSDWMVACDWLEEDPVVRRTEFIRWARKACRRFASEIMDMSKGLVGPAAKAVSNLALVLCHCSDEFVMNWFAGLKKFSMAMSYNLKQLLRRSKGYEPQEREVAAEASRLAGAFMKDLNDMCQRARPVVGGSD